MLSRRELRLYAAWYGSESGAAPRLCSVARFGKRARAARAADSAPALNPRSAVLASGDEHDRWGALVFYQTELSRREIGHGWRARKNRIFEPAAIVIHGGYRRAFWMFIQPRLRVDVRYFALARC